MERKKYLDLCQKNSVYPESETIIYQGGSYYPLALKIWFDKDGVVKNTAEVVDCISKTKLYCDIKDISEEK